MQFELSFQRSRHGEGGGKRNVNVHGKRLRVGKAKGWEKQKGVGTGYRWGGRVVGNDYGK